MDDLTRVRRATTRRASALDAWREAIRAAVANGYSMREVGQAAGISHVQVLRIVRGE
jgi:transposase-like protein